MPILAACDGVLGTASISREALHRFAFFATLGTWMLTMSVFRLSVSAACDHVYMGSYYVVAPAAVYIGTNGIFAHWLAYASESLATKICTAIVFYVVVAVFSIELVAFVRYTNTLPECADARLAGFMLAVINALFLVLCGWDPRHPVPPPAPAPLLAAYINNDPKVPPKKPADEHAAAGTPRGQ